MTTSNSRSYLQSTPLQLNVFEQQIYGQIVVDPCLPLEPLLNRHRVISPHDQYQRNDSFFEHSLDSSMSSMSAQFGDLDVSTLGLGVGDRSTAPSSFGRDGGRRGILSGNVNEFRYRDEDDEEEDEDDDRDTR